MENPFGGFADPDLECLHAALTELLRSRAGHDWLFDPQGTRARLEIGADGAVRRAANYGVPAGPERNLLFRLGSLTFQELQRRAAARDPSVRADPYGFGSWEHFCGALMDTYLRHREPGSNIETKPASAQPA